MSSAKTNQAVGMTTELTNFKIGTVAVVGVGLIGGSFAAALKQAGCVSTILGAGRRPETLEQALSLGLIDEAVSLKEAAQRADLIFVAAPVGAFESIFKELAPTLGDKTIITDGGSTKQNVIEAARLGLGSRVAQFIPGHPMAGSHEKGPQAADPKLYVGRRVMLTPLVENHPQDVELVSNAWKVCGANVVSIEPAQHDGVVAAISHMPHWVAALFMEYIIHSDDAGLKLQTAGSGFRDFTRVAQGSPEMWRDIFMANRSAMLAQLHELKGVFERAEHALQEGDAGWLEEMLDRASKARRDWQDLGS
jgi:prephenate dehydrogenase